MPWFKRIPVDKQQLEQGIAALEAKTSAELRIFIERKTPQKRPALERALELFYQLEMQATQGRNGVLIYLAYKDHQCAIIGDQGIDQFVDQTFWQQRVAQMTAEFKQGEYTRGILAAMETIGDELAAHFPIQPDDVNELDNEVIIND